MTLYELKKVKKYYNSSLILDLPSLNFEDGNFYAIHGPNASGKTTLLNILSFLDNDIEGEVNFHGNPRSTTLVMQNPYLFNTSVINNISYGLTCRSLNKKKIGRMIEPIMKKLAIWELRNKHARSLSGGEVKRVALARALSLDAEVILLDEPTSHLDKTSVAIIEDLIGDLKRNKEKSIIVTSHDLKQASEWTTNIMYLFNGKIVRDELWNLLKVELFDSNGVKKAKLNKDVEIYVATNRKGPVHIVINPRDIIITRAIFRSSALNNLKAKITSINEVDGLVDLVVECGIKLHVFLTHNSFINMELRIGQEIFIMFKASAIEVF